MPPDGFIGRPFLAEAREAWNRPDHWRPFYRGRQENWLATASVRRGMGVAMAEVVLDFLLHARATGARCVLDAGCGECLTVPLLAHMGFVAAGIVFCPEVIELMQRRPWGEEDLSGIMPMWERGSPGAILGSGFSTWVDRPGLAVAQVRALASPGGQATWRAVDWNDPTLPEGHYDVILCRNGLRCATKAYWRRSLRSFHRLLAAGGLLVLQHINAIGIREEVVALLAEEGFQAVRGPGEGATRDGRRVFGYWPTG